MGRKYCVIDAEGVRDNLLGVAFYSDFMREYCTHRGDIIDNLHYHAQNGYTFVAHNASYDLSVIFWTLDLPMRAVYYNGKFNRGQWKYSPKRPYCELWDSYNLSGNLPLEQLGIALNLPKYETPQRLRGIDPDRYEWLCDTHGIGECIECYAIRDAEIVYRYMESLTDVIGTWAVEPAARIAGIAQSVWRSLDRPEPIEITDKRVRHLGRRSYFGGRVECLKLGHIAPLYTADFASMYPSVMAEGRFPDPAHMVFVNDLRPADLPLQLEGAAECLIHVPASHIPPLPNSYKDQRVYGTGLQRGYWTLAELRYAVSIGCTPHRVYRACWSTHSLSPFTTLIGVLWELRQEYKRKGDPRAQTVKVLLNSCYGRLGLRGDLQRQIEEPWNPALSMSDYMRKVSKRKGSASRRPDGTLEPELSVIPSIIDGKPFVSYGTRIPFERTWQNVLWASQITALARIKLHQCLTLQGHNAVYCDTDSVFSIAPIAGLGEGLGALTDHTQYAKGWIVGPKLYCLEGLTGDQTVRAKGVPRDKALSFLRGDEIIIDSPVTPRSQQHGGPKAGEWIEIHRSRQLVPHRRVPINPELLEGEYGWSDTLPMHIGPG
jgi:hypothetical protein